MHKISANTWSTTFKWRLICLQKTLYKEWSIFSRILSSTKRQRRLQMSPALLPEVIAAKFKCAIYKKIVRLYIAKCSCVRKYVLCVSVCVWTLYQYVYGLISLWIPNFIAWFSIDKCITTIVQSFNTILHLHERWQTHQFLNLYQQQK